MTPFTPASRVALSAGEDYGFALAGGYAVQAHGLARRASKDVDLFTMNSLAMDFDAARDRIIGALRADGWVVSVERTSDTFARLVVTDESTNQDAVMELAVDWRAHDPVRLELGPVLHPDDAIATRCPLCSDGRWPATISMSTQRSRRVDTRVLTYSSWRTKGTSAFPQRHSPTHWLQ